MKRILFFIACMTLITAIHANTTSPASALYSGSYLQRSEGANAVYWNPARLYTNPSEGGDLILLSTQGNFWNNTLDVDLYNKISGDSLSMETREEILNAIDGNYFDANGEFHMMIVSWSKGRNAYSVGTHVYGNAKISKEYFDLLLTGNDYGDDYHFSKDNNDLNLIGYGDLTIAYGGYPVHEFMDRHFDIELPKIYVGFAVSALFGAAVAEMKEFEGNFAADSTALELDQTIRFRYGTGGIGAKALIGVTVEDLYENLSVGLTLDNLPGFITWGATTKEKYYSIKADSVNISEADSDTIENTETTKDGDTFTTELPLIFNLGACYTWDDLSVSLDWRQAAKESVIASNKPMISFAGEYLIADMFPFRLGTSFDTGQDTYAITYGIGYRNEKVEIDYAIQTYEQIFPTGEETGTGYSLQLRLKY